MSTRWTEADVRRAGHQIQKQIASALVREPRHGNVKMRWQGMKFDSKRELEKFKEYELERIAGNIRGVIRQVSIPLTGHKRRIRIDFMIIDNNGRIRFVDAKGHPEREWLLKRDLIYQQFGLFIDTV